MSTILTVTLNPCVDHIAWTDHVELSHKIRAKRDQYSPGGGGINVAKAVHSLGGQTLAIFPVAGETGLLLTNLLEAEHIDQQAIQMPGRTRVNANIFEEQGECAYRIVMPGPNIPPDTLDQIRKAVSDALSDASHLVISGSMPADMPPDFLADLIHMAHKHDCPVIADTSGQALRQCLGHGLFMIKPNLRELQLLTDNPLEDDRAIREAAQQLAQQHKLQAVLVSLGTAGALLATPERATRIHSPTVRVQSRIGAGDSTVAGFTVALSRNESLPDAARYAVAAGAAAVMQPAMQLCNKKDADELYKAIHAEEKLQH